MHAHELVNVYFLLRLHAWSHILFRDAPALIIICVKYLLSPNSRNVKFVIRNPNLERTAQKGQSIKLHVIATIW